MDPTGGLPSPRLFGLQLCQIKLPGATTNHTFILAEQVLFLMASDAHCAYAQKNMIQLTFTLLRVTWRDKNAQ